MKKYWYNILNSIVILIGVCMWVASFYKSHLNKTLLNENIEKIAKYDFDGYNVLYSSYLAYTIFKFSSICLLSIITPP